MWHWFQSQDGHRYVCFHFALINEGTLGTKYALTHRRTSESSCTFRWKRHIYTRGTPINDFFYWKKKTLSVFWRRKYLFQTSLLSSYTEQPLECSFNVTILSLWRRIMAEKCLSQMQLLFCSVQLYAEYDMTYDKFRHVFVSWWWRSIKVVIVQLL